MLCFWDQGSQTQVSCTNSAAPEDLLPTLHCADKATRPPASLGPIRPPSLPKEGSILWRAMASGPARVARDACKVGNAPSAFGVAASSAWRRQRSHTLKPLSRAVAWPSLAALTTQTRDPWQYCVPHATDAFDRFTLLAGQGAGSCPPRRCCYYRCCSTPSLPLPFHCMCLGTRSYRAFFFFLSFFFLSFFLSCMQTPAKHY